jgi:hypothetical protein
VHLAHFVQKTETVHSCHLPKERRVPALEEKAREKEKEEP